MRNFRGNKALKIEFLVTVIILAVSVVFSIENREYFVENALERHYDDLSRLSHLHSYLQEHKVTSKDLNYTLAMLDKLDHPRFILKDDVQLDKALAYFRLGQKSKAETLLRKLIQESLDPLSTADGVMQLARLYQSQENYRKACELLEKHQKLFLTYRRSEMYFLLARLYSVRGRQELAGRNMVEVDNLPRDQRPYYRRIVEQNWTLYSREEQKRILDTLARFSQFQSYADLARRYIGTHQPTVQEVQDITLNLVINSYQNYVTGFIRFLGEYEAYQPVYEEMLELHTLAHNEIDTESARVRGQYYYRKLSYLNKLSRYSADNALSYYNAYLKGAVEPRHAGMNLELTIRNLLAYKKYALITNVVESTYTRLAITNQGDYLTDHVSFWNAYAHLRLGQTNRAVQEFEHAIAEQPDSYYAIQSREIILSILKMRGETVRQYVGFLEKKRRQAARPMDQLMLAKVVYAFVDEPARSRLRPQILDLAEKTLSRHALFGFEEDVLRQFRLDKNYIKFIAYTRYGMADKARVILTSSGISDPALQEIMLLKELIRNRQFNKAYPLLISLKQNTFLDNHFAFLNHELKQLYYPRPFDAEVNLALTKLAEKENLLDSSLVYAIIRGESMYMQKARSHAGARGLMQLMPATARMIAGAALGTTEVNLYNPLNNIILGTYYLNDNVRSLGLMTAIATYNGGYAVIKKVKTQFRPANELELMEIHPYRETRLYIKKILSNYYRYQETYPGLSVRPQTESLILTRL